MSLEQAVVDLERRNAILLEEVVRFRDAAMGLNNIHPNVTEGRQNTADGKYFSIPGNGAYMRLYRRQGSSAELIAEFPDRDELNNVIDQLGPLLGREVSTGLDSLRAGNNLLRIHDAVYAARARHGRYHSGSSEVNVDEAPEGECALYSANIAGTLPPFLKRSSATFAWIETQSTYTNGSLIQQAWAYTNSASANTVNNANRFAYRICSASKDSEGNRRWSRWLEPYTEDTILGTVSQSGGVPDGAIIERVENANGEYVKLADGTLICTKSISLGSILVFGNGTRDNPHRTGNSSGDWAHPFSSMPSISALGVRDERDADTPATLCQVGCRLFTEDGYDSVFVARTTSIDTDVSFSVHLTATGRWY